MLKSCLFIVFMLQITGITTLNILVLSPPGARSHFKSFHPLFIGLAEKGHNVTVFTSYPTEEKIRNYKEIPIAQPEIPNKNDDKNPFMRLGRDEKSKIKLFWILRMVPVYGLMGCRILFESKSVQEFLQQDNTFDIVITMLFNTDCALAIAKKYKCPIVRISASSGMPWVYGRYGLPLNPSYMPNIFLPFSDAMTFWERLENTLLTLVVNFYNNHFVTHYENELVGEYLGDSAKTLHEDIYKDSLLLVNRHFVYPYPLPAVPNIIEVGGINVGKNKPLLLDLEKWITEAKHGVIYFSLGSVIKGQTMPEDKKNAFINAFKRMPQRVIWKWENDTMEGKADNIRIGKWLPQFDILSHPNVKAFISHGGLLGTMEAVHSGTPMVIMPQFGDQHTNAQAMLKAGGGVVLYMSEATEDSIYEALKTVLEPKFQTQMKELSERFRDRPMSPLDTAIYWVEYVARHKGAHFMKTAAVGMPFYQYYLLDVIAFILFVLFIVTYLFYVTLRFLIKKITGSISRKSKTKQKKL